MQKVVLSEKLAAFHDTWSPKIVGQVNDCAIKLVKLRGEFPWHKHDDEDELFMVLHGQMRLLMRDRDITLQEGEFFIVPRGVEHQPVADEECHIMLIEPYSTRNTGDITNDFTVEHPETL